MTAGAEHSCGVAPDEVAYCWGNGEDGRLGTGNNLNKLRADLVLGPTEFAHLSAGRTHTCGVATDGGAYCWGDGSKGQLGSGTTNNILQPFPVDG
ncbi:MAG: hypothetical protein ACYTA3_12845, partial [Planctomycetota bacterium]